MDITCRTAKSRVVGVSWVIALLFAASAGADAFVQETSRFMILELRGGDTIPPGVYDDHPDLTDPPESWIAEHSDEVTHSQNSDHSGGASGSTSIFSPVVPVTNLIEANGSVHIEAWRNVINPTEDFEAFGGLTVSHFSLIFELETPHHYDFTGFLSATSFGPEASGGVWASLNNWAHWDEHDFSGNIGAFASSGILPAGFHRVFAEAWFNPMMWLVSTAGETRGEYDASYSLALSLTPVTPVVPEPATLSLFGLGLAGFWPRRLRKRT